MPLAPIAILGAGSWGTALALHLSRSGQSVRLWTYERESAIAMQTTRTNARYLPGFIFPDSLHAVFDLNEALAGIQDVLIAVPSSVFYEVLLQAKPLLAPNARIASATKGLDKKTGHLLHTAAQDALGTTTRAFAAISGPSFAREVAAELPTAIVAASEDPDFLQDLVTRFNGPLFRVYSSTDVTGVELCGVVKNVLAIATGISDGMHLGTNARSALITRGLAEMTRLGVALGGQAETFMGLAGVGDLVLTCTDDQSRNRRFGLALGQGKNPADAEREIGQVVEGKANAGHIEALALKHQIEMPIVTAVQSILKNHCTPLDAMQQLLSREPGSEY